MTDKRTSAELTEAARRLNLDHNLAAYLAASATVGAIAASEARAVVVFNTTVQPFGINGDVSIDFNSDGQIDYQIDHDRFNVNGTDLDFLQLDKNDVTSPEHPYGPFGLEIVEPFPLNGTQANGDHEYLASVDTDQLGFYPKALLGGMEIGPLADNWDFQEGDGFGIGRDTTAAVLEQRLVRSKPRIVSNGPSTVSPNSQSDSPVGKSVLGAPSTPVTPKGLSRNWFPKCRTEATSESTDVLAT